jgi:hypothetical protein
MKSESIDLEKILILLILEIYLITNSPWIMSW